MQRVQRGSMARFFPLAAGQDEFTAGPAEAQARQERARGLIAATRHDVVAPQVLERQLEHALHGEAAVSLTAMARVDADDHACCVARGVQQSTVAEYGFALRTDEVVHRAGGALL